MNKADLVKLAMQKQAGKTSTANQPSYLTKNGSIFNAPNAQQTVKAEKTSTADGIAKLNNTNNSEKTKSYNEPDKIKTADQGRKAIAELKEDMEGMNGIEKMAAQVKLNKLQEKQKGLAKEELKNSQENLKSIARGDGAIDKEGKAAKEQPAIDGRNVSASEGKAMAKDAEANNKKAEQQTAEMKRNNQEVRNFQKDAKKTQKDVKKDEAKFNKDIAKASKDIAKNQTEMAKESQQMSETRAEIDSLQAELQSLTADSTGIGERSAFSLKLAGEQSPAQANGTQQAGGSDETSGRIAELQAQIGEKADKMEVSGQKLQKLQTSTNKSITVMHNTVRIKSQYYSRAQKTTQANQNTSDKIMDKATKIGDVMQTISTTGKTLQTVGKGMILAGKALASTVFGSAAGAALITAGGFTQKAGTITEMVGNYGQMAANVVKTACNVADGNFAAALQTAGAAIQTGVAAHKTASGLSEQMDAIDASVEQAQTEAAISVQAKEAAKQMKESGQLEAQGLTEKQARSQIKGTLTEKANNGEISFKNGQIVNNAPSSVKMNDNGQLQAFYNSPRMDSSTPTGFANGIQTSTMTNAKNLQPGAENKLSFGKKVGNAVKKGVNQAGNAIKKAAKDPETLAKIGKEMVSLGAKMAGGTQSQQAGRTTNKNYSYPQYNINYGRLAQGEKMMKRIGNGGRAV